jgi:3-oxoacyl-[acyl-carrier-protein] synthase-3
MKMRAAIKATAGYVPDYVLTNQELETILDTSDQWIQERTGIKERRILKDPNLGTSYMGIKAMEMLLEKSGTKAEQLDALICATATPDLGFVSSANLIAAGISARKIFSFDIQAACSGFLYALEVGAALVCSGNYRKVAVVGADKMSSVINYQDRNTAILFGDGAGAVLLEPDYEGFGLMDAILYSDAQTGKDLLHIKAGGSLKPTDPQTLASGEHYFFQEGKSVFRHAVNRMSEAVAEILQKNKLSSEDIAFLVPHQANRRIVEAIAERINFPMEKITMNLSRFGNTTGATLPLCLWEWEKLFKKGDNLILAAFGGGFTWGAAYLKWAY